MIWGEKTTLSHLILLMVPQLLGATGNLSIIKQIEIKNNKGLLDQYSLFGTQMTSLII